MSDYVPCSQTFANMYANKGSNGQKHTSLYPNIWTKNVRCWHTLCLDIAYMYAISKQKKFQLCLDKEKCTVESKRETERDREIERDIER